MVNVVLVFYFVTSFFLNAIQSVPEVKINQGRLRGVYDETWKGRVFSTFLGIPFAEPPIGNLRFKPPVPAAPWEGIWNASEEPVSCPQTRSSLIPQFNEDCLYLNVYTPQLVFNGKQQLFPVMYFIHGGLFSAGNANPTLCGANLLLDKDVVLVASNYRLGALGFLTTGDEIVPGNNGLKDQNMAIRWIKDNIEHFGGDPEKITVVGFSAGSASAHYHTLSSMSKDLIHGAILHSGTALAMWALAPTEQTVANTKRLANFFDCPVNSSEKMIECLRKIDADDIVAKNEFFEVWNHDLIIPFRPVIEPNIEGAFLTEHPSDTVKSGKTANVPVMTGITTEDGSVKSAEIYDDSRVVKELNLDFNKWFSYFINCNETAQDDKMLSKTSQFYFKNQPIDNSTKSQLTDFFTDVYFLVPHITTIKLYQKHTKVPVYAFVFGYRGSFTVGPFYGDPSHYYGVSHGDDISYILVNPLESKINVNLMESDNKIIDILTTLWANFARTGNPTSELNDIITTKWDAIEGDSEISHYFIKNENDIKMAQQLYSERINFWESFTASQNHTMKDEL